MRAREGDKVRLFNGSDGEWIAQVHEVAKKRCQFKLQEKYKEQAQVPDLWLLFAPVKRARLDYLVQKATELGADHVINYKEAPDYSKHVFKDLTNKQGVDIAIDSVGSATFETSVRLLKSNGKLVTCGATTGPKSELDIRQVFWKQLQIIGSTMSNQREFREVMELVFAGKLKPVIDKEFALEKIVEAETHLLNGNQFGKIILSL